MNVTTDQFVRRDGQETSKLIISDNVMSSSKDHGRIFIDALANLTFPIGMSGWRCGGHHLERRCGRK